MKNYLRLFCFFWVAGFAFRPATFCQDAPATIKPERVFAMVPHAEAVEVTDAEGGNRPIYVNTTSSDQVGIVAIKVGETIKVNEGETCDLVIPRAGSVHMTSESAVRVPPVAEKSPDESKKTDHSLELLKGKLFINVDAARLQQSTKKQFRLKTPSSVLAVRGTRFFAEVTEDYDSVGVNEGNVVALEPSSGATADIKKGYAIAVKEGQVSPARRLTQEEESYDEIYDRYAVNEIPGERSRRKYKATFNIYDPKTEVTTEDPKKIRVEDGSDPSMPGTILKMTMKPHTDINTGGHGDVNIELNARLRREPVGVSFSVRSTGMKEAGFVAILTHKDAQYGESGINYIRLNGKVDGTEWTPIILPVYRSDENWSTASYLSLTLNMMYRPGDPQYTYLTEGLEEYSLEISPISILTRGIPD